MPAMDAAGGETRRRYRPTGPGIAPLVDGMLEVSPRETSLTTPVRRSEDRPLLPSAQDLDALFRRHNGDPGEHGWRVRMRRRFGYFSPDEWYEAVVDRLVAPGCRWVDVGGGKSIFPQNRGLSRELANRCAVLVGVDPSDNIYANEFVHERVRSTIEAFEAPRSFDLATFRMVAEHVQQPRAVVEALARLLKPGGHAVIYTPNRWSPSALAASLVPDRWHTFFARVLDTRSEEDVFPTCYRMNTRKDLRVVFERGGFTEASFAYIDNCRNLQRFRIGCFAELTAWRLFRAIDVTYPENDLLGIYRRV